MSVCFFFSSRRRHTRLQGDWSSDVCSSDLPLAAVLEMAPANVLQGAVRLQGLTSSPTPETQVRVACAQAPDDASAADAQTMRAAQPRLDGKGARGMNDIDRKSTRLNSSHLVISYAVFC